MQVNAFFLPSSILHTSQDTHDIYIVIDLIRATTCMAVIFDRGAQRIFAASTIEQARAAKQIYPKRLLCGERNVKPLPGFDYGNSPVQFAEADLTDRELIMTTTNGTRAFHACPPNAIRLAGSLYNAGAVVGKALELARASRGNIHLVCAGEVDTFGLDDAVCAGYLTQEIQRQAQQSGRALDLDESALAAMAIYEAYRPPKVIEYTSAARSVIDGGLPDDPTFCMSTNVSQSVGMVVGQEKETRLLIIERA